jgi:hypothetical protein
VQVFFFKKKETESSNKKGRTAKIKRLCHSSQESITVVAVKKIIDIKKIAY